MVTSTATANDLAVAALQLPPSATVLEVGFGQGRTVARLVAQGHTVLGVDPSTTMVQQAVARNRAACRQGRAILQAGDGVQVPFGDGVADAAYTVHTVYFMPDRDATFRDIARVVRPGGLVAVAWRPSDTPVPTWMDPEVYRVPTRSELAATLDRIGYADVEVTQVAGGDHPLALLSARLPG
jgi:ubiquinone/menaquinone biosynthesis C-methylase UbiE